MELKFGFSLLFLLFSINKDAMSNASLSNMKIDPLSSIMASKKFSHINLTDEDDGDEEYAEYFELFNNSNLTNADEKKIINSKQLFQLRRKLLMHYDPSSRPISDNSKAIDVGLSVTVVQINDLDAVYQVIL